MTKLSDTKAAKRKRDREYQAARRAARKLEQAQAPVADVALVGPVPQTVAPEPVATAYTGPVVAGMRFEISKGRLGQVLQVVPAPDRWQQDGPAIPGVGFEVEYHSVNPKTDKPWQASKRTTCERVLGSLVGTQVATPVQEPVAAQVAQPVLETPAAPAPAAKTPRVVHDDPAHVADAINSLCEARLRRLVRKAGHENKGLGPVAAVRDAARSLGLEAAIPPSRKLQPEWMATLKAEGRW